MMTIKDLVAWTRLQRVAVTIRMADGQQYLIDGRLFRKGVFQQVFREGKLVGKRRASLSDCLTISEEKVETIWLMDFVISVHELERLVRTTKARKVSKNKLWKLRLS